MTDVCQRQGIFPGGRVPFQFLALRSRLAILPPMISFQKAFWLAMAFTVLMSAGSSGQTSTDFERECDKLARSRGKDTERLHKLFKLDWEQTMMENPELATEVGHPGQNHRWS